ncbi:rhomboid family intramembrane serine protease [Actinomadura kijaniata]|uniref:rhomboid family intramembrane serine protease n=1 Tax=Actinomadura kijaniata TaxID=46161 RepID=UPI003F1CC9BB
MSIRTVLLYVCAVAVIAPGSQLLAALATQWGRDAPAPVAVLRAWRRPVPMVAAGLVGLMAAFGVVQTAFPSIIDHLERQPGAEWWRVLTALLVQSSGWSQLLFNLAALAAVAPIAERYLGPWRMVLIYGVSGVIAQAVSMAGWSRHGAGNSVAICGLVGALAAWYALRGAVSALRRTVLLIPAAGVTLCLLTNNHGVGILVGAALGAVLLGKRPLPTQHKIT